MAGGMKGAFMTGVAAARKPIDDRISDGAMRVIESQLERAGKAMLGATHQVRIGEPWKEALEKEQRAAEAQMKYLQAMQATQATAAKQMQVKTKTLDDFGTADLVMEMLKRGFAVMKMPEDGSLPETLK